MLEDRLPSRLWPRRIVIALLLALISAALIVGRVMLNGEFWLDRTYHLVLMVAIAAFIGAYLTWFSLWILPRRLLGSWAPVFAVVAFGLGFMGTFGSLYVLHSRLYIGDFEINSEAPIRSLIWSSVEKLGLFLISSPTYLLPWVLPILVLIAYKLLPYGFARSGEVEGPRQRV